MISDRVRTRGLTAALAAILAAGAGLVGSAGISVQAAAPGTAAYTQMINRAIMYSEDVYCGSRYASYDAPMDLSEAIACAYADAKPVSDSKSYAYGSDRTTDTNYTWDGSGNITSKTVKTNSWYDQDGTWNYQWDGSYLTALSLTRDGYYTQQTQSAGSHVTLGPDGRPQNLDAPTIPTYAAQYPQAYGFAYDAAGRITAVNVTRVLDQNTGEVENYVNTYAYNKDGTLRKMTKGDGSEFLIFHYDAQGKLVMSFCENTNGGADQAVGYSYDAAGRPVSAAAYNDGSVWYQQVFNYNY